MAEEVETTDMKEGTGDEVANKSGRKRKRQLYQSILNLMEFYFSDANLLKSRFMNQLITENGCVDLCTILSFNKLRALTTDPKDVIKAVRKSNLIQVSEDGTKIFRTKPVQQKQDIDACTIYVEQLPPDADHDWLTEIFSEFGPVDYISIPKFKNSSKIKGFAFVEFQEKESVKKALEVFGAKGCCLSPQMPPDQLASIRTFESDSKSDHTSESKRSDAEYQQKKKRKHDEKEDSEKNGNEVCPEEKRKKLKDVDSENDVTEDELRDADITQDEHEQNENISTTNKVTESDSCDKPEKVHNKQNKVKSLDDSSIDVPANKERKEKLKRKKCHSESSALEDTPKKRKKFKSENDAMDGEESCEEKGEFHESQDDENDMEGDKKKKRKRKKKHKKEKLNIAYLGLHIMSKIEWKKLRNKYLDMQKRKMKSLKNHLAYAKWEYKHRQNAARTDDEIKTNEKTEETPTSSVTPGVIIKVTLEHPVIDVKTVKSESRIHPEIKYVDVKESSTDVYLRTSTPEVAQQVLATKHWPNMELLQGEEEEAYWKKIVENREKKLVKNCKPNQRGRDKLLKRAEKLHGKYIGFDER